MGKKFIGIFLSIMLVISTFSGLISVSAAAIDSDLILNYTFDSGTVKDKGGTQYVEDMSGSGHDGKLEGTASKSEDGKSDGALHLDGDGDVKIPSGIFDGLDSVTVAAWVKFASDNNSMRGWERIFDIGKDTENDFFISRNRAAEIKVNGTLYSIGSSSEMPSDKWIHVALVLDTNAKTLTFYENGSAVKEITKVNASAQQLDTTNSYIGHSKYSADPQMQGDIDAFRIYKRALQSDEINGIMEQTGTSSLDLLNKDAKSLSLGSDKIFEDISLPSAGKNGSQITWFSNNHDYLSDDGKVTRPAKGSGDAKVTLTATLILAGESVTKDFKVAVLENDPRKDLEIIADNYQFDDSYVTDDIILPTEIDSEVGVSWESSKREWIGSDGKVTRPEVGAGNRKVTLTATFKYKGYSTTRKYKVTVMEKAYGSLLSYIVSGDTDRTDSLHLAIARGTGSYKALHNDQAILYATKGAKKMGSPTIFRKSDGTFGLIATDNNDSSSILVYDSKDLLTFTNERYVEVNQKNLKVTDPTCKYDNSILAYRLNWVGSDGKSYCSTTKDFSEFTDPVETTYKKAEVSKAPSDAIEASSIEITESEYKAVYKKYSRIYNTGITGVPDSVTMRAGSKIPLPSKVTATYSDGSTKDMGVVWDTGNVGTGKPGTYQVAGTVQQTKYANPLINQRADPYVVYDEKEKCYYFTASYPTLNDADDNSGIGYDRIILRKASTISGLAAAKEVTIWNEHDDPTYSRYIWAPEMHRIGDKWYIFCTASITGGKWAIRPIVLSCNGDGDPMKPENWKVEGQVRAALGDHFAFTHFSLDMTCFKSNGQYYLVWAEKPKTSDLYIATIDPSDPTQLTSKAVRLSTPNYAWEWKGNTIINEGPAVLQHKGKIFVCFSAAAVDDTYCVGMLSADADSNLLDSSSWKKNPYPILTTSDFSDEYGPGHNSFTVDAYGNPVIVYHARNPKSMWTGNGGLNDPGRNARVKNVNFAADGDPVLNMTYEEELSSKYKTVVSTVIVKQSSPHEDDHSGGHSSSGSSGGKSQAPSPAAAQNTDFKSDTTGVYNFSAGILSYRYKITTTNTIAPSATSSNPSVATVEFSMKLPDGYLFQVNNVGIGSAVITTTSGDGTKTTFTVQGTGAGGGVLSDTPGQHKIQLGKTYQFKFTVAAGKGIPTFTVGDSRIAGTVSVRKIGNSYYCKLSAVSRGSVGVYVTLPGIPRMRKCIITVS